MTASIYVPIRACLALAAAAQSATVDFSAGMDPPLVKKFAQYNAGLPPLSHYDRDLPHIASLRADHLRLDLGMGKGGDPRTTGRDIVTGTAERPVYDFTAPDHLARMLLDRDVLPYYAWCYVPFPLQRIPGDYRTMRGDASAFAAWRAFHRAFGARYAARGAAVRAGGPRVGYHEIYNEPDLQAEFLQEPFSHYLEMYRAGALGIREGDPEAVVGGPALAMGELFGHAREFTDFVKAHDLPLDFFSFHHYWSKEDYPLELATARAALGSDPRFRTVPVHVNELNWSGGRIGEGSVNNRHAIAARILDVMERMLESHDVALASWAQFMESTAGDDAYGIIHRDGRRKAAYNAFRVYADMPEERKRVSGVPEGVGLLASAAGGKAAVAAWNRGDAPRTLALDFAGIPFPRGRLRVFRIDRENASSGDGAYEDLRPSETRNLEGTQGASWTGTLPASGVAYLVWDDGTEDVFADDVRRFPPSRRPGRFLRTRHWFPDRASPAYAWFDRKAWTARLGMGTRDTGECLVAVRADSLAERIAIRLASEGGRGPSDARGALALRIDFEGPVPASLLLHWGRPPADGGASIAWGTGRAADRTERLDTGEAREFDLRATAPPGWNGAAHFSFLMRDAGQGSRAVITLARTDAGSGVRESQGSRGAGIRKPGIRDARGRQVRRQPKAAGEPPFWLAPREPR